MASIHERFEINVPAEGVYEALSRPERIVGALPGVSSIYRFEHDRYRVDIGAAGRSNELDLEVTERVLPRRIAWRSRDGRWTGSVDVESLGPSRTLVIVHVNDSLAVEGGAEGAEDAAIVDAALKSLKQALETAAETGKTKATESGERIRVDQGTGSSRSRAEHEESQGEDQWRGSRKFFREGSDQAFAMMRSLSREMDRLWEQVMRRAATAGRGTGGFMGGFTPPIEMCEQGDEVRVCAEVPGIEPDDLHVEVDEGLLVLRGERRSDTPSPTRSERVYGSFVRRIPLPEGLRTEDARASLRHGVLEVRIPVARARRGHEVPIETADAEHSS